MKKIHYSTTDDFPLFRVDLVELFVKELPLRGLDSQWFTRAALKAGISVTNKTKQTFYRPPFATGLKRKITYWVYDLWYLLTRTSEVDAIQCRDKYIASLLGLIICRLRRKPFFYWCSYPFPEHDLQAANLRHGLLRHVSGLRGRIGFLVLYGWICRLADHVFVQSDAMLAQMKGYGVAPEKMTVVPMGVPARLLDWHRTKAGTAIVPQRVVYLGTLAAIRKLDVLLHAFQLVLEKHPNAELILVGDGDEPSERRQLEVLCDTLGIAGRVKFTGFLPMEQAWDWVSGSAVCVSPIAPSKVLDVGSPTKLIEYMALGRPVVCNDHPEQSQIMADSHAGICVSWSAQDFAQGIIQLLDAPEEAERMARLGPPWVAANRTYGRIADTVWARYRELLNV